MGYISRTILRRKLIGVLFNGRLHCVSHRYSSDAPLRKAKDGGLHRLEGRRVDEDLNGDEDEDPGLPAREGGVTPAH